MRIKKIPLEEINANEAFDIHSSIIEREKVRRELMISNVVDLVSLFDKQAFRAILGDENGSWSAYLSQLEVWYSRGTVEKWRKIYSRLTKELQIEPFSYIDIPESRLEDIVKIVKDKDDANDLFSKAKLLIPGDWKSEIFERRGKPTQDECNHEEEEIMAICKKCGFKHKVNEKHTEK